MDVLVLSGGGVKGASLVGALDYLHSIDELDKYRTIVGTSIGSVIAVLIACGITPNDIFQKSIIINHMFSFNVDITSFIKGNGVYRIEQFIRPVESVIKEKLGTIPTLEELHDNGYDIYITVCNLTKARIEFLSYKNCPKLRCSDALKMACSIPIVFKKCIYKDCHYVDAGMYDNIPLDGVPEEAENILALDVSQYGAENTENFFDMINCLISLPAHINGRNIIDKFHEKYGPKFRYIHLPSRAGHILDLACTTVQLLRMYQNGHDAIQKIYTEQESDDGKNETVIEDADS